MGLHDYVLASGSVSGGRPAIVETDGQCTSYGELMQVSAKLRARLAALGVGHGDRVGIYLGKSADSIASLLGVLFFPVVFPTFSTVGAIVVDLVVLYAALVAHWVPADLAA